MKLTKEQSRRILGERGIGITEACDKCGLLLGAVRWTRKCEPGEWCSAACRDGIKAERPTSATIEVAPAVNTQQQKRIGSRPSGRPRTHATNAEKQRSYRSRLKNGLALRNTPSEHIENARLADAKNGSYVVPVILDNQALETAVSASSASEEGRAPDEAAKRGARFFWGARGTNSKPGTRGSGDQNLPPIATEESASR